jgi:hypothetical protein
MTDFVMGSLVPVVRDICIALFASWLFAKYYNRISDYWAQRSSTRAKLRVDKLQKQLQDYESDYSNTNLFVARMLGNAVRAMLGLGMFTVVAVTTMGFYTLLGVGCLITATCITTQNTWHKIIDRSPFVVLVIASMLYFIFWFYLLRLEIDPALYRSVMKNRIERLTARL